MFNDGLGPIGWLLNGAYAEGGRESIAPERLLRAQLLQVLYSLHSERQLVEQINYNLLYRWFVGLSIDHEARGDGRNTEPDFHGERRLNDTHASASDPDAPLRQRTAARRRVESTFTVAPVRALESVYERMAGNQA